VRKSQVSVLYGCVLGALLTAILLGNSAGVRFREAGPDWGITGRTTYGNPAGNTYILESTGNGVAVFDFNSDGRNDLLITNGTRLDVTTETVPGLFLYRNDGQGHFTETAATSGLVAPGWAQGTCVADYDNDGYTDVAVTYYGTNKLFHNTGGHFEDVSKQARLQAEGTRWGTGCVWLDYDRDGFVDLFIANYVDLDLAHTPKPGQRSDCVWKGMPVVCGPVGLPKAHNVLYRNRGDGTFEDVSSRAGILKPGGRFGLGVVSADFNNDGWPDIYVACDQTPSLLYENRHDGTFKERAAEAGVAYNADGRVQSGMGVAVADVDGNGFLDIVKTNFSGDLPSLYLNEDGHFFHDAAQESGLGAHQLLGWGTAFVDADEDGRPDLIIANGHVYPDIDRSKLGETYRQQTLFYRNLGNGKFADLTASAGEPFRVLRPGRGLATGDLDGDGRPEIVIVNMNEPPTVLKNESPRGAWIRLALEGTRSNRSAIGALVTVEAGGRNQMAEVAGGGSYYSQNEFALYFGLGQATRADEVTIRWPNGKLQVIKNVAANRTIHVREPQ